VVAHRLGINAGHGAEFDRQFANATMRVVPSLPAAQKSNYEGAALRKRQRRRDVRKGLAAASRAGGRHPKPNRSP